MQNRERHKFFNEGHDPKPWKSEYGSLMKAFSAGYARNEMRRNLIRTVKYSNTSRERQYNTDWRKLMAEFGKLVSDVKNGRLTVYRLMSPAEDQTAAMDKLRSTQGLAFLRTVAPEAFTTWDMNKVRMDDGTWKRDDTVSKHAPAHHFAHPSVDNPLMIAYYESEDKFNRDIQTRTKPGKYFKKVLDGLYDEAQIKCITETYLEEYTPIAVKMGTSEADFLRAVAGGTSDSCMANKMWGDSKSPGRDTWHASSQHPAVVYAGSGDIGVAWFEKGGQVAARVLYNTKTKHMARCYGDAAKLLRAMKDMGYSQQPSALAGCRLRVIKDGLLHSRTPHIMVYVDAGTSSGGGDLYYKPYTDPDGVHWWMTTREETGARTYAGYNYRGLSSSFPEFVENGVVTTDSMERDTSDDDDDDQVRCSECDDYCDSDCVTYSDWHDRHICDDCLDIYTWAIYISDGGHRRESLIHDDYVTCIHGVNYLTDHLSDLGFAYCDHSEEWINSDDAIWLEDGMCVHERYTTYLDHGAYDNADYRSVENGAAVFTGNELYIHRDDAVKCWYDGEQYHREDCVRLDLGPPAQFIGPMLPTTITEVYIFMGNMEDALPNLIVYSHDLGNGNTHDMLLTSDYFGVPALTLDRATWDSIEFDNTTTGDYFDWPSMTAAHFADEQHAEEEEVEPA